jgi:hypothetical protein
MTSLIRKDLVALIGDVDDTVIAGSSRPGRR